MIVRDTGALRKAQLEISRKVLVRDVLPRRIRTIGGFDVAYRNGYALSAGVVLDFETLEIVEKKLIRSRADFPYIPTFLSFREGPPIIKTYKNLENTPDILMINGQGIAHPLRAGLASHIGVVLGKPSIGVAQRRLVGEFREPESTGDVSQLFYEGLQVGWVLKSAPRSRPIFISPGHMISLETSLKIVKKCLKGRKLPEPLVLAHKLSKIFK